MAIALLVLSTLLQTGASVQAARLVWSFIEGAAEDDPKAVEPCEPAGGVNNLEPSS